MDAKEVISEIKRVVQTGDVEWVEHDFTNNETGRAFIGSYKNEWRFIVVEFDIEPQGFPPGSRGYDGTATDLQHGTIIHLTRELAKELFEAAKKEESS